MAFRAFLCRSLLYMGYCPPVSPKQKSETTKSTWRWIYKGFLSFLLFVSSFFLGRVCGFLSCSDILYVHRHSDVVIPYRVIYSLLSRVFSVDIYRPLVVLKPGPKTAGQLECIVVVVSDLSPELLSSNLFLYYVLFFFSSNMYILYSFVVFTCATTWSRLIYSLPASYIRLPSFHPTHPHIYVCNNNIDHDLYLS